MFGRNISYRESPPQRSDRNVSYQKLSDRDLCMCKKHSKMQFKLDAITRQKLHMEKNIQSLCSFVTCDNNVKECLINTCNKCKEKNPIDVSNIKEENDFSENYVCKMNAEIQAMHFGSSHNQTTLHTFVMYTESGAETISPSKRHDPSAIWAHLMPVLTEFKEKN